MSVCCIHKSAVSETWWNGTYYTKKSFLNELAIDDFKWMPRNLVENDSAYKQLIPYILVKTWDNKFVCYRRAGTEKRLHAFWSCGVGGHIEDFDFKDSLLETIYAGAHRELSEEFADYDTQVGLLQHIGTIHENETDVGLHHIGLVMILQLQKHEILHPDKELVECGWLSRDEMYSRSLELWSRLALKLEEVVCRIL